MATATGAIQQLLKVVTDTTPPYYKAIALIPEQVEQIHKDIPADSDLKGVEVSDQSATSLP